jgi:Arc/MetJ-type ribon-helix-helix transcriptional regulator
LSTVIVSFKAPADLVEQLDELVRRGVFNSRSEALRRALVMLVAKYRV